MKTRRRFPKSEVCIRTEGWADMRPRCYPLGSGGEGGRLESMTGGRSGTHYNIPRCAGKRKEDGWCGQVRSHAACPHIVDDPLL